MKECDAKRASAKSVRMRAVDVLQQRMMNVVNDEEEVKNEEGAGVEYLTRSHSPPGKKPPSAASSPW